VPAPRRLTPGIILGLVSYVLLAWPDVVVFALAPLGALLALSRPGSTRERIWISVVLAWGILWIVQPGGVATQTIRAAGVMVSGAFVALTLKRPDRLMGNIAGGLVLGVAGAIGWTMVLGVTWSEVEFSLGRATWATWQAVSQGLAALDSTTTPADAAAGMRLALSLFPALTALAAIGGLLVAWATYQRVASHPVGAPAGRFSEFRGSDQFLWGLVIPLGILVSPLARLAGGPALNLLVFFAAIYAARGAAVFTWLFRRRSGRGSLALGLLALAGLFILPIAGSGLVLLGVSDTWIDFRRRVVSAERKRGELP